MMTRKQHVEEILKCGKDPIYFIKRYCFIQHPTKGRLPLNLYPFQEECIESFVKYKKNIVLKSRQLGLSTITSAYCLWMAVFQRDVNICIMATKLEVGKNMIQKIRVAFKMLPEWMLEALKITDPESESVKYIKFSNGSKITAIPTAADAGRSEALSLLVIDEAAHIENFAELWTGLFSTLSTGGKAIIFSTPKGKGHFFTLWQGAETKETEPNKVGIQYRGEGKNGFHAIKLPWTVHPERGQDWYEEQCAGLDERGIAQELLCSFEGSSMSFFNDESIQYVRNIMTSPALNIPVMIGNKRTGDAHVWRTPVPGHEYVLSADVARGDAEDFSTFYIFDTTTSEAVVEYQGKVPPDRFAAILDEWGRKYNMAKIANELNSVGLSTSIALKNIKYPNLYYPQEVEEKLISMTEEEKAEIYPGLTMGPDNRERILQFMEQNIRTKKVRIFSERFLVEMETFIWNGKRGQAQKKKHDDLIMAAAIGLQMFSPNADLPSMFAASSGNSSTLANAMLAGMGRSSTPGGIKKVGYARFAANTTSKQSLENEMLLRKEFGWLYKQ
jgi:hypothetical protein